MNNQSHAWVMKIRPKTEKINLTSYERILILDHEETSHIRFWDVFHEIRSKISFHNPRWKVSLMTFDERKKLEVGWKNAFVSWNGVRRLSFLTLTSFHTSHTSMNWKFLETRSQSSQLSQTLSLSLSSCSPKPKCANEA